MEPRDFVVISGWFFNALEIVEMLSPSISEIFFSVVLFILKIKSEINLFTAKRFANNSANVCYK